MKERFGNVYRMHSNQREAVEEARAGDIVVVTGLRFSAMGDTLCEPSRPVLLEEPQFPETVISMAIEPRSSAERDRLLDQLSRLMREDPTFKFEIQEETGQIVMSGMGELHLEVIRNRSRAMRRPCSRTWIRSRSNSCGHSATSSRRPAFLKFHSVFAFRFQSFQFMSRYFELCCSVAKNLSPRSSILRIILALRGLAPWPERSSAAVYADRILADYTAT